MKRETRKLAIKLRRMGWKVLSYRWDAEAKQAVICLPCGNLRYSFEERK